MHGLRVEAARVLPPAQTVLRVHRGAAFMRSRGLLVRAAVENQTVDRLQRPSARLQTCGQPIDKLWMRRRLAPESKVAWCAHESLPEMMVPKSVDDHTRGERIVGTCDPFGERPPPASLLGLIRTKINPAFARPCDRSGCDLLARILRIPPVVDVGGRRERLGGHCVNAAWRGEGLEFILQITRTRLQLA